MTTLTDFLLARIAEDENDPWRGAEMMGADRVVGQAEHEALRADEQAWEARVLAECEAKRRIVELHEMMPWRLSSVGYVVGRDGRRWDHHYTGGCCALCTAGGEYGGAVAESDDEPMDYCDTLLALALPFAEHPEYDERWRP